MSQECRNARKRGLRYVDCVTWIALLIYGAMQVALRKQSAFMRPPTKWRYCDITMHALYDTCCNTLKGQGEIGEWLKNEVTVSGWGFTLFLCVI